MQFSYCSQCPPALNDTQYRQFWISWKDGIIAYGNGSQPGMNVVGVFADPTPIAVNYMSIASYAGVVADWIIPEHLFNTSTGTLSCTQSNNIFSFSLYIYKLIKTVLFFDFMSQDFTDNFFYRILPVYRLCSRYF